MRIDTLSEFTDRTLNAKPLVSAGTPQADQAALALISRRQQLDLNQPEARELGWGVLVPALLAYSRENKFIKFDPWDNGILIKQFDETQVLYQYNPFRDPKNRQASGQKAAPPAPGSKPPDFLAWETFPENEHYLVWTAASGQRYGILVQPVPIVPDHLIVASLDYNPATGRHDEQIMTAPRLADMNELLGQLAQLGYAMGFNGRHAGASVDHFHTQAVPRHFLPVINLIEKKRIRFLASRSCQGCVRLRLLDCKPAGFWDQARRWLGDRQGTYPADSLLLEADRPAALAACEQMILAYFQRMSLTYNSIAWLSPSGTFREIFFPRGQEAILNQTLKAGYVEMSGMMVIPNKTVFDQIEAKAGEIGIKEAGPIAQISSYIFNQLLPA